VKFWTNPNIIVLNISDKDIIFDGLNPYWPHTFVNVSGFYIWNLGTILKLFISIPLTNYNPDEYLLWNLQYNFIGESEHTFLIQYYPLTLALLNCFTNEHESAGFFFDSP